MQTNVIDLRIGKVIAVYSCEPEIAVIAAYAQARGDFNTWDYSKKYGARVYRGGYSVSCGDYCAMVKV